MSYRCLSGCFPACASTWRKHMVISAIMNNRIRLSIFRFISCKETYFSRKIPEVAAGRFGYGSQAAEGIPMFSFCIWFQENVLSYPNASRKCVLFWENVLGGTKCIINVVAAGGQTRPLRYCVIRGLSSDSCRWRNRDMVGQNTLQYYFRQPGRMILVDFYRNQLIAWYL